MDLVNKNDPHREEELSDTLLAVQVCQPRSDERNVQLKGRLRIGDAVTEQQKTELFSVLLQLGEAFLHSMMTSWVRLAWWNT